MVVGMGELQSFDFDKNKLSFYGFEGFFFSSVFDGLSSLGLRKRHDHLH